MGAGSCLARRVIRAAGGADNLARFVLLPGQRHDSAGVAPLIEGIEIDALTGAKGFVNDWLRKELDDRGALAVIPPKRDRKANTISPCIGGATSSKTFIATLSRLFHQAALAGTLSPLRSNNTEGSQPDTARQIRASKPCSRGHLRFGPTQKGGVNGAGLIAFPKRSIAGAKREIILINDRTRPHREKNQGVC